MMDSEYCSELTSPESLEENWPPGLADRALGVMAKTASPSYSGR